MWLGDFPVNFTTVPIFFTTHDGNGAPVAPNSAFEAADVKLYKDGNAAERTSNAGWTMTSPFDTTTGLHRLLIDLSDNTDAGFYATGHVYTAVLSPDETVNSQAVVKVLGQFGIGLGPYLQPTTAGRTLDVSAGGEAGVDWANVGSPTTSVGLSGTTIAAVTLSNAQGYKKNTAVSKFMFPMFDLSLNPATGLTGFTAEVSIDAAAFAAITDSVTEVENGWYEIDLTAGEMNGNEIALRFAASGARETTAKIRTVLV